MTEVRVVAGIAISGKKIFIARRSPEKSLAGLWEFPGGKVEAGESDEAALQREIKEEFGKDILIGEKFFENTYTDSEKTINLISYFMAFTEFPKTSNSHDQLNWITIDELSNFKFCPADEKVVQKLISTSFWH